MTKKELEKWEEERKRNAEIAGEIIGLLIEKEVSINNVEKILKRVSGRIENQKRRHEETEKIEEVYATRGYINNDIMKEF